MAKAKLKQYGKYIIQPIEGENYDDCEFLFNNLLSNYEIRAVDGQYFQTMFDGPGHTELNKTWWDSEGFKITETK